MAVGDYSTDQYHWTSNLFCIWQKGLNNVCC
jgi:hypothetical protein